MVICGTCGNNSCNGGYGEVDGKTCADCEGAYKKMETEKPPVDDENLKMSIEASKLANYLTRHRRWYKTAFNGDFTYIDWRSTEDHLAEVIYEFYKKQSSKNRASLPTSGQS